MTYGRAAKGPATSQRQARRVGIGGSFSRRQRGFHLVVCNWQRRRLHPGRRPCQRRPGRTSTTSALNSLENDRRGRLSCLTVPILLRDLLRDLATGGRE